MGCDHLDVRTFRESMGTLHENHEKMWNAYTKRLFSAYNDMKKAWNTPKGWRNLVVLSDKIHAKMESTNKTIEANYYAMYVSGNAWARSQYVSLNISPIPIKVYESYNPGQHDGVLNEVKKEEVKEATVKIKQVLNEINDYMNTIDNRTREDELFGYYSTDNDNPREAINESIKSNKNSLSDEFKNYMNTLDQDVEEDNKLRENALKEATDKM